MDIMQAGKARRIFVIAGLISLCISYLGIWLRFINDPIERTGSDFIAFYTAGRIAQIQGAAKVYDPLLQQQIQQKEVGFQLVPGQVLLYNHLPYLIPVLQFITGTTYVASFYRWISLLITLYVASVLVLSRVLKEQAIDKTAISLATAGALLFLPVFFSLMNGQDTAILFLGAALWMYGLFSGREYLAGLGLGLATVRPHIALFLAIPMLFYSIRIFGAFVLSSGILASLSLFVLGAAGTREFIHILVLTAGGEWYGMKENAMFNLIGLLTRGMPWLESDTIRILGWLIYAIAMAGLCILWRRSRNTRFPPVGATATLALFVAPHLHFHDLALLLIPIYALFGASQEPGSKKTETWTIIAAPIAISLMLLTSNLSPYLQYTVPYLIMLILAIYPYYRSLVALITRPHRS